MQSDFYRKDRKRFDVRGFLRRLGRNRRVVLALVIGMPLLGYFLFGSRGLIQRIRLSGQKSELQRMIKEAEAEQKKLQAESKALEGDKKTIEKVARERYGMVREGEKVYRVKPKE